MPLPELVRDVIIGRVVAPAAPPRWCRPQKWESLTALAALADDLFAPSLGAVTDRRPGARTSTSGQPASGTRPLSKRHLISLHAARAWVGDRPPGRLLRRTRLLPISMAETPEAIEGGAPAALCRGDPGSHRLALTWARSRSVGGRGTRRPSRFLEPAARLLRGAAVGAARPKQVPPSRGRLAGTEACGASADLPILRGADLATGAERTVGRCATCPLTHDRALRATSRVAVKHGQGGLGSGLRRLHGCDPDRHRRATTHHPRRTGRDSRVGARKLELYADEVLTLLHVDEDQSSTSDD